MSFAPCARSFAHSAILCALVAAPISLPSIAQATDSTPVITGTPATGVTIPGGYSFQPQATESVTSPMKFVISNLPVWAQFDESTGRLSGSPGGHQAGIYKNIVIRVNNWYGFAALPAFSIEVLPAIAKTPVPAPTPAPGHTGSVTLDWTPPTENTDGTALMNLNGYLVRYGTSPTDLTQTIRVTNPGLASYVVDNLPAGKWYFAMASHSSAGDESALSDVIGITVP
jgi:hypothetical protein